MRACSKAGRRSRCVATAVVSCVLYATLLACQPNVGLAPDAASGTLFGSTVQRRAGEDYQSATARTAAALGGLPIVRYFEPGMPDSWASIRSGVGARPAVISFKLNPQKVVAGVYDNELRRWFSTAPTRYPTYWALDPEPEDDIAEQSYTAEDFRTAWDHVADIATSVANPALKATLILMCYTLAEASGRDWRDYYPGDATVDVLAWDCYNRSARFGRYETPARLFGPAVALNGRLDKPFGVAEFGSILVPGDSGAGRASWLTQTAEYLSRKHAVFVTYFDSDVGADYRLLDEPSIQAWRAAVSSSE